MPAANLPRDSTDETFGPLGARIVAAALVVYAVIAAAGILVFRWDSLMDVALPALVIACWMEVVYVRQPAPRQLSLLISGLGWLAVAVSFAVRGPGALWQFLRVVCSLLGFLAILGGGWFALLEAQQTGATPSKGSRDSVANPEESGEPPGTEAPSPGSG